MLVILAIDRVPEVETVIVFNHCNSPVASLFKVQLTIAVPTSGSPPWLINSDNCNLNINNLVREIPPVDFNRLRILHIFSSSQGFSEAPTESFSNLLNLDYNCLNWFFGRNDDVNCLSV